MPCGVLYSNKDATLTLQTTLIILCSRPSIEHSADSRAYTYSTGIDT